MKTVAIIAQMLVRITGLIQIVLGVLFWTDNALALVSVHIFSGVVLVVALAVLAILAAQAGVDLRFVLVALVLAVIVLVLGLTQGQLLIGSTPWVIQVLHLLLGLGAIGQAEGLATRMKHVRTPVLQT